VRETGVKQGKIIKAKLQPFVQVRIFEDWKLSIEDILPLRTRSKEFGRKVDDDEWR
jgi:hypothetical protein